MTGRVRLFTPLLIAGFLGVLSFQLVDFAALIAMLPQTAGKPMPFPMPVVRLLSLLQSAVLVGVAVFVGLVLSSKVGLSAPAAESLAYGRSFFRALMPQIVPGLIGGLVGGIAIIASGLLWKPYLPAQLLSRAAGFNKILPALTRILYGGITEELLLRWGFMTFLVWASWKLFQKGRGTAHYGSFVLAIIVSSVLFGMGHLPLAILLNNHVATAPLLTYVVTANALFGFIAGFLFWKKGLESAIIAHITAHVVMLAAVALFPSIERG